MLSAQAVPVVEAGGSAELVVEAAASLEVSPAAVSRAAVTTPRVRAGTGFSKFVEPASELGGGGQFPQLFGHKSLPTCPIFVLLSQ